MRTRTVEMPSCNGPPQNGQLPSFDRFVKPWDVAITNSRPTRTSIRAPSKTAFGPGEFLGEIEPEASPRTEFRVGTLGEEHSSLRFSVGVFSLTQKRGIGRPKKEVDSRQAASIYEFGVNCLQTMELMREEDWRTLAWCRSAQDAYRILKDLPYGFKLIGSRKVDDPLSLPSLIAKAFRERDFPKVSTKKQRRYVAFSIAAEGALSGRRSRKLCLDVEHRRKLDAL